MKLQGIYLLQFTGNEATTILQSTGNGDTTFPQPVTGSELMAQEIQVDNFGLTLFAFTI